MKALMSVFLFWLPLALAQWSDEFVLEAETVSAFCGQNLQAMLEGYFSAVSGGMAVFSAQGAPEASISIRVLPSVLMGGSSPSNLFEEIKREAQSKDNVAVSDLGMGDRGLLVITYDRDGSETGRTVWFSLGDLVATVSSPTGSEQAACSSGGVMSLAAYMLGQLAFEADLADSNSLMDPELEVWRDELLKDAERVALPSCVVGSWLFRDGPLPDVLIRQFSMLSDEGDIDPPIYSGQQRLVISASGEARLEYSFFSSQLNWRVYTTEGVIHSEIRNVWDGTASGMAASYRKSGKNLLWLLLDMTAVGESSSVQIRGMPVYNYSGPVQDGSLADSVVEYSCSESTLTLTLDFQSLYEAPLLNWNFTRN